MLPSSLKSDQKDVKWRFFLPWYLILNISLRQRGIITFHGFWQAKFAYGLLVLFRDICVKGLLVLGLRQWGAGAFSSLFILDDAT